MWTDLRVRCRCEGSSGRKTWRHTSRSARCSPAFESRRSKCACLYTRQAKWVHTLGILLTCKGQASECQIVEVHGVFNLQQGAPRTPATIVKKDDVLLRSPSDVIRPDTFCAKPFTVHSATQGSIVWSSSPLPGPHVQSYMYIDRMLTVSLLCSNAARISDCLDCLLGSRQHPQINNSLKRACQRMGHCQKALQQFLQVLHAIKVFVCQRTYVLSDKSALQMAADHPDVMTSSRPSQANRHSIASLQRKT